MKTRQKGFIAPLVLTIVAILVLGGGAYVYLQQKQANPPATENVTLPQATSTIPATNQTAPVVQTTNSQTADWKTYTNAQHGYTIQYPADVEITLWGDGVGHYTLTDSITTTTSWYASTCVTLSKKNWYVSILADAAFSATPCGATGTSATNHSTSDTVTVNGKQITVTGRIESDRSGAIFHFGLNDKVSVEYGVTTFEATKAGLSEQDYQAALDALHAVLTTLKPIQNFTPTPPPPNGRG